METITDRLNRRSLELNVSQADIIRATGAGRGTVSGWFSGANAPSAKYWLSKIKSSYNRIIFIFSEQKC